MDAGGYVIKLSTKLLGEDITLESCIMNSYEDFDVDLYGSYIREIVKMRYLLENMEWTVNTNVCYPYGEVEELCKRIVFLQPPTI